jgi:prepilin-type N-terminal cleavage/methylation domain-containing protein
MLARGFSLIEMLIVIAIAGIVLAIAVPSFQETIVNGRSRGVAESIQFGLIKARSDAISRNAPMRFQLVSTLDATCTASSTSRLWVVTQYTGLTAPANTRGVPAGACNIAAYVPPDQEEPCPATPAYTVNTGATPPTAASCICRPLHFLQERGGPRSRHYRHGNADHGHAPWDSSSPSARSGSWSPTSKAPRRPAPRPIPCWLPPPTGVTGRSYCVQVNSNGTTRLCPQACPCT